MTACIKICHMAEAAGLQVVLHGGGGRPEGQHLTWAMPNTPWAEFFIGADPGVPLADSTAAGALAPRDGYIDFRPCGPGFGLGIEAEWLEPLGG